MLDITDKVVLDDDVISGADIHSISSERAGIGAQDILDVVLLYRNVSRSASDGDTFYGPGTVRCNIRHCITTHIDVGARDYGRDIYPSRSKATRAGITKRRYRVI